MARWQRISESQRAGGYGAALLAASLWGLIGPVARLAFGQGTGPLELAFWRAVLAGALFLAQARLGGGGASLPRRHWPAALAFGAVGVALFYASYHRAVAEGGAALAAVLLYTAPAQVAVLGPLVLGERMTAWKAGTAGLAVGGAALVAFGGDVSGAALSPWAFFWGLLASGCYAAYYLFGRHYFQRYDAAAVYAVAFPFGALCLLPLALLEAGASGHAAASVVAKPAAAWGAVAWIGLASTYAAYRAHGEALRRLEATRVSVVTTLEPVVAGTVAYLWFGEQLGLLGWLGGAVVVGAALAAATERSPAQETLSDE